MEDKFNITLVRSRIPNRPYTKTDGKYIGPTWNNNIGLQTLTNHPTQVFEILRKLQAQPDTCMVTGTAVRPQIINTDRTLKNFSEEPLHMLVLDLDKYPSKVIATGGSPKYDAIRKEVEEFIEAHLPPEFQGVTHIIRFSSSFLIGEKPYLRCHIIFLLEEPQYPREIGMWLKNDKIPADATFYFNLTQPIFTSAPLWVDLVDPLSLLNFPRIGLVPMAKSHVPHGWQPYFIPKHDDPINIANLPAASALPGKIGSFCRMVDANKILTNMGYSDEGKGRYLAPSSDTGVPGAIIFPNGYAYSHHEDDPINQVVEHVYRFRRRSLNAYDLMFGWAQINKEADPAIQKEFEFLLNQAILNDIEYQNEVQNELVNRLEWLVEGDYEHTNRQIIDGVIQDMYGLGLSEASREYIFHSIKSRTKHIGINVLRSMWKNRQKDLALSRDTFDPEANLRHMANIFKRQKILYSHHKTTSGDYWCYFSTARLWKMCNRAQTEAFIYNHIHAAIPLKMEIDYHKAERLIRIIMREACLSMSEFRKGAGWAFKGGRYGVIMEHLFSDRHQWQSDSEVRTLRKEDHIYKELPISYSEWKDSKNIPPSLYLDFLVSSCEEDIETVELLREYGGYILADSYYLHKMLILEGVPGSGKSIFAKILQQCLGTQYHAAISIKRLVGQFGLGPLPGKKLAVMSEARDIEFNTLKAVIPILLKIVGQDYIDTEMKRKTEMTELLECKILMMTNRTPVLPDDTGALAQRLMMVRFNKCFRGTDEEVLGLDTKILKSGLASIIRWHLEGLARLSKRKTFIEPASGIAAKSILIEQIDPLRTFIATYFVINPETDHENWIVQKDFNRYFMGYLKRLGQPHEDAQVRKRGSIRNIKSLFPKVHKERKKVEDGTYKWKLVGMIPAMLLEMEFVEELSSLT